MENNAAFSIVVFIICIRCSGSSTVPPCVFVEGECKKAPNLQPGTCQGVSDPVSKLEKSLREQQEVDLIFIIDKTPSISCQQYECAKHLVLRLVNHFVENGAMAVGPNHARIAYIEFDQSTQSVQDGISGGFTFTSCNFEYIFMDDRFVNQTVNSSMLVAMQTSQNILNKSMQTRKMTSQTLKQILVTVTDGVSIDNIMSSHIQRVTNIIIGYGVQRYAIGQDNGAMTRTSEYAVTSLATDKDHYGCRYHWSEKLYGSVSLTTNLPSGIKDFTKAEAHQCPTCKGHDICVCDMRNKQYRCADSRALPSPIDNDTRKPIEPSNKLPAWLWPLVGALAGGLVLVIIIIAVSCSLYHHRKEGSKRFHPGPELPTPPVPRRRRNLMPMNYEPEYGNTKNCIQSEGQYNEVQEEGQYSVIKEPVEEDHDIAGWASYLEFERKNRDFIFLAIHNMQRERWSSSLNYSIKRKEVKDVFKLFTAGGRRTRPKVDIKLADKRYRMQMADCDKGSQVVATRIIRDKRSQEVSEEVAVVLKEEHYLVIGIADMNKKIELIEFCKELKNHFEILYTSFSQEAAPIY